MRIIRVTFGAGIVVAALAAALLWVSQSPTGSAQPAYVGANACVDCHSDEHSAWSASGHPWKLRNIHPSPGETVVPPGIPLPDGYTWDDISYVVGGYKWKSRYVDLDGYFITEAPPGNPGNNQYNLMTGNWVDYHAGEVDKPYNCGKCHTTGYAEVPDDPRPGIVGSWEFEGIQCERCHGPGSEHAVNPTGVNMTVDTTAAACGECHYRGDLATIPAKGGFIRHHEQNNELLASPHDNLDCVSCHEPHTKAEFSITTTCADCHTDVAESYAGTPMDTFNVSCEDCHMPMATKSAEALGPHQGDVKTHLFTLNTDPAASMFTGDGSFVQLDADGKGAVTLDFACLQCHQDRDTVWAAAAAAEFHAPEPGPIPTPTSTPVSTPTATPEPAPSPTATETPTGPTSLPLTGAESAPQGGLGTAGYILWGTVAMFLLTAGFIATKAGRRRGA